MFELPTKHTILIIESVEQHSSDFYKFCISNTDEGAFKYQYDFCCLTLSDKPDSKSESMLKRNICFEEKTEKSEALLYLRAAILKNNDAFYNYGGIIRYYYPNLPIFFIASDKDTFKSHTPDDMINQHLCYQVNHRDNESILEFILNRTDQVVDECFEAPFWNSLKTFTDKSTINFHSLPIGRGRSITNSINDFAAFFGEQYLRTETSLSSLPLDSLLLPHGPIKEAQNKAAIAFGANDCGENKKKTSEIAGEKSCSNDIYQETGTRFVTNGTSTAIHIIISAFVNPDDFVLLERNCHISHYNALAAAHAKPLFLKPFVNSIGVVGPVPLQTIQSTLWKLLEEQNCLPAVIILTNPTFDGIFYKPQKVVAAVRSLLLDFWNKYHNEKRFHELIETLTPYFQSTEFTLSGAITDKNQFVRAAFRRMVFLIDEAWGSYAYFHPKLIECSAMHAALILSHNNKHELHNCLRFYSTQSTHKSLSAFRQGSMIHYRDPLMSLPAFRQAFEHSIRSHTTSSPNAGIIASLDVARRQVQLEGLSLVERSINLSDSFRQLYMEKLNHDKNHVFSVGAYDRMFKSYDPTNENLNSEDFALDPTKVTITWSLPIDGQTVKRLLLSNSVQINKYSCNSVLAIFNIGVDDSSVEVLKSALATLSRDITNKGENIKNNRRKVCTQSNKSAFPNFSPVFEHYNLGYWLKNMGRLEHTFIEVEKTYNDMMRLGKTRSDMYISAAFVTPYPPGYPVLIPGQVILAQDLNYLLEIPITEIMGVESINGRMNIHVYLMS